MGRGFVLFRAIFLFQFIFFPTAFALELRCAGVLAGVYPLGSEAQVVQVETILEARGLSRYAKGLSVQQLLKQSNRFGLVAVRDENVVGFLVAERKGNYLAIEAMAVAPDYERQGVGRELIDRLSQDGLKMVGIEEIRTLVAYDDADAPQPQLQMQPVVARPKLSLKLETIAVTREELLSLDPVLAESLEMENDYR